MARRRHHASPPPIHLPRGLARRRRPLPTPRLARRGSARTFNSRPICISDAPSARHVSVLHTALNTARHNRTEHRAARTTLTLDGLAAQSHGPHPPQQSRQLGDREIESTPGRCCSDIPRLAVSPWQRPDSQVPSTRTRHGFRTAYQHEILPAADACTTFRELEALLRQYGVCSSPLSLWRAAQRRDEPPRPVSSPASTPADPTAKGIAAPEHELARATATADRAEPTSAAPQSVSQPVGLPLPWPGASAARPRTAGNAAETALALDHHEAEEPPDMVLASPARHAAWLCCCEQGWMVVPHEKVALPAARITTGCTRDTLRLGPLTMHNDVPPR